MAELAGPGSQAARAARWPTLFAAATADEQRWLRGVVTGEVRQGALDALVQEAVASRAESRWRRYAGPRCWLAPRWRSCAAAFERGRGGAGGRRAGGGAAGAADARLRAPTVTEALAKVGRRSEAAIDTKLDGIRIQVHRSGDEVLVVTRSLDDITDRLPEVVDVARALPTPAWCSTARRSRSTPTGDRGRSRRRRRARPWPQASVSVAVTPYFFDVLHLDGRDLLDSPGHERAAALDAPGARGAPRRRAW